QLSYWKQKLSGTLPVLELPTDRQRGAVGTSNGESATRLLSPSLTAAFQSLSRQEECTLFMTLLAAFKVLLHRYTEQTDLIVGSPGEHRVQRETGRGIGPFANSLPLRTDLSGNPTYRELLSRVREVVCEAYAHQELPFEKLAGELRPEGQRSGTAPFQVMFL